MPGQKPWDRQKVLVKTDIPGPTEMREKILALQDKTLRFVAAFLYLTGCRIGELVQAEDGLPVIKHENICGHACLKFILRNKKNRSVHKKILPVRLDDEPGLCDTLTQNIDILDSLPGIRRLQYMLSKLGWNPHYLRHVRITHLILHKKFNDQQLRKWAGWTDTRPANVYVHLRYEDLV